MAVSQIGYCEAGGLVSYGANMKAGFARLAYFVERIAGGARAGDIPMERPTVVELVVNLKTAKALGLTVPLSLLARADEVIE
jgi:putative ABC transport system substrate-binding protein